MHQTDSIAKNTKNITKVHQQQQPQPFNPKSEEIDHTRILNKLNQTTYYEQLSSQKAKQTVYSKNN